MASRWIPVLRRSSKSGLLPPSDKTRQDKTNVPTARAMCVQLPRRRRRTSDRTVGYYSLFQRISFFTFFLDPRVSGIFCVCHRGCEEASLLSAFSSPPQSRSPSWYLLCGLLKSPLPPSVAVSPPPPPPPVAEGKAGGEAGPKPGR